MNSSDLELPSNKSFGFFFSAVFGLVAVYLYVDEAGEWMYLPGTLSALLLLVTVVKPSALRLLNNLWMRFGLLLGMIVSPIVLAIIFFGLFTPIAVVMRIFGRDELRLQCNDKSSHWISRSESVKPESFRFQF